MAPDRAVQHSALVHPAPVLGGRVVVPGDKSISHRVAMLSGLAHGTSRLEGFLRCEDCINTLTTMCSLGARSYCPVDGGLHLQGTGGRMLAPARALDVGNSGTSMRLISGLLAGQKMTVELSGDASLNQRPMRRIQDPLQRMGARIELLGTGGTPPIRIHGAHLTGMVYELPVASAQVKSCVLLAGLFAAGPTTVVEPRPTRDHTERALRALGVDVRIDGLRVQVDGFGRKGPFLPARHWQVPGDFSSAAFLMLAAGAREGQGVELPGVGLNPRRTAFADVLRRMGADVSLAPNGEEDGGEPAGTVVVRGAQLTGTEVGGDEIPNLIDELPLVAVAGALATGRTVIRDAAELRVKESDRIAAMAENLRHFGVKVDEADDGMTIHGGSPLKPLGSVQSFGDHRIAMAMAVLALYAEEPVCIGNIACIETSYPGFWQDLEQLGAHVEH